MESMVSGMGRTERRSAMALYVTGLLLDGDRKSIQPMAARLVDGATKVEAMRQRLQECVVISGWSDAEVFRRLTMKMERELPGVEAFVIDDTGFPKKGTHSVGVSRQYSGTMGRVNSCQIAVSLHLAGESGSGCIAMDLYLPTQWAANRDKRKSVGVPEHIEFREKYRIALAQLDAAMASGARRHVVLADAAYGDVREFREGLTSRGLDYMVGLRSDTTVWTPGSNPKSVRTGSKPYKYKYEDVDQPPQAVAALAKTLQYQKVGWREGSRGWQSSRFAVARVRTSFRHHKGVRPGEEQWLLAEWPEGKDEPTTLWLSNLPASTSLRTLVRISKLRWRVERDYQELKQEIGLDHFEGRTWRGFHHHVALCAVAHGFLALRRALSPPEPSEMDAA